MKRSLSILFISILLLSCGNDDSYERTTLEEEINKEDLDTSEITLVVDTLFTNKDSINTESEPVNSPEISTMDGFPEKIDGCSCYFSFNEEDLEDWKFIYADDYHNEVGYIVINGEEIELDHKNPNKNEYQVDFEIEKEEQTGYEVHKQWGIMRITGPNGEQYTAKYVGECGC